MPPGQQPEGRVTITREGAESTHPRGSPRARWRCRHLAICALSSSHPQTYEHNEWIIHLAGKLLANDAQALSLLALNPFAGRAPPR